MNKNFVILLLILTVGITFSYNIYSYNKESNEKYIYDYFGKLISINNTISTNDTKRYINIIKESSYITPIYRKRRIFNLDKKDPYRYVDGKFDEKLKELRLIFVISNKEHLDKIINKCEYIAKHKAEYVQSKMRRGIQWPAALYQNKFDKYSKLKKLNELNIDHIFWCGDISSFLAHDGNIIKPNTLVKIYLWHKASTKPNLTINK